MILNSIRKRISIISNIRNRSTITGVWESLDFFAKLRFLDLWSSYNVSANLCQILAGVSGIFTHNIIFSVQETLIGFGCFLSWTGIVQYLKPNPSAYTVGNTLSRAVGTLGPYIIGILPIFLAFVFFATSILWKSGNYNSLPYSMILQFAMINGDSLCDSISSAVAYNNFFGMLYMYCFLVFFIWYYINSVIHNIFIAIITDSYESLKYNPIKPYGEFENNSVLMPVPSVLHSVKEDRESLTIKSKF